MALSEADKKNLTKEQQQQILALTDQYNAATTQAERDAIHAQAEEIRFNSSGGRYSGGADGSGYTKIANNAKSTYNPSRLNAADASQLNAAQQARMQTLQDAWRRAQQAGNQSEMGLLHQMAEQLRNQAGYTGGADGGSYMPLASNAGGMTADQMQKWLEDYRATNVGRYGYNNGYSVDMNVRSQANKIRQQMLANSQAWQSADPAQRDYLHQQNEQLAALLKQYAGGVTSTYNPVTGQWETGNPEMGYGRDTSADRYDTVWAWKNIYGYTDEEIEKWANDTSHYFNFVDTRVPHRNLVDESSGFTGQYANFINGPYSFLKQGTQTWANGGRDVYYPEFKTGTPELLYNNGTTPYTRGFSSYTANGVIEPGLAAAASTANKSGGNGAYSHANPDGSINGADPRYSAVPAEIPAQYEASMAKGGIRGQGSTGASGSPSGGASGGYNSYLEQMYAAALESQLANLKASYDQNISDLDASKVTVDDTYTEQKRQTTGTAAQSAANWREMANAYGLNSGAIGQAALAQNNQLQSNLNTLESAQAAAQAEIERQRTLLGQQYQLQINQAIADNNFELASALYQEAVRQDEALRQQQQFAANLALQYAQMAMQQSQFDQSLALDYAKLGLSSSSGGSGAGYIAPQSYVLDDMFEAAYQNGGGTSLLSSKDFREKFGFGDASITDLRSQYNRWLGTLGGSGLNNFRTIVNSSPTMSVSDKNDLAWSYYQNGEINYTQLQQILKELGTGE